MPREMWLGWLVFFALTTTAEGHGLRVSNVRFEMTPVACPGGDEGCALGEITFDVGWNDSWRGVLQEDGYDIENWDAAWIFVKVRASRGTGIREWRHAAIEPAGTTVGEYQVQGVADRRGVFVFQNPQQDCELERRGQGACWGKAEFDDVRVRWMAGRAEASAERFDLWVHGLEMVFVPTGPFQVGEKGCSTSAANVARCFYNTHQPAQTFEVASEDALGICSSEPGVCYVDTQGQPSGEAGLPASFPKGYQGFYAMKYELDQGHYADFVNSLPVPARTLRFSHGAQGAYRYEVRWNRDGDARRIALRPDRASNWVSWSDAAAYLDWAGLRPMSELEFEKLTRGPGAPVGNSYAWGSTWISTARLIVGSEEDGITVNGNAHIGANELLGGDGGLGPLPGHAFLETTSRDPDAIEPPGLQSFDPQGEVIQRSEREREGRSYYGALHLTGNLWEYVVNLSSDPGRAFSGQHGDGELDGENCAPENQDCGAQANVEGWPGRDGFGIGFRGGAWYTPEKRGRIVDRHFMDLAYPDRSHDTGIRGVRTVED